MDISIDWSNFRWPCFALIPLCIAFLLAWLRCAEILMRIVGVLILLDLGIMALIWAILFLNFIVQIFLQV